MSDERLLTLLLATSGIGLGASALLMKDPTELPDTWYQVVWPHDVDVDGVVAFLRSVAGDQPSTRGRLRSRRQRRHC